VFVKVQNGTIIAQCNKGQMHLSGDSSAEFYAYEVFNTYPN